MKVRYNKLWRLMKNNKMKKSDLAKAAQISSYSMTKLNNDLPVNMDVMMNLCKRPQKILCNRQHMTV